MKTTISTPQMRIIPRKDKGKETLRLYIRITYRGTIAEVCSGVRLSGRDAYDKESQLPVDPDKAVQVKDVLEEVSAYHYELQRSGLLKHAIPSTVFFNQSNA